MPQLLHAPAVLTRCMMFSCWGPFESWRQVWHVLDTWGEYQGVYQLLDFFPQGLLAAVYFSQGQLLCDALLPEGTERLFEATFAVDGTVVECQLLPPDGAQPEDSGIKQATAPELSNQEARVKAERQLMQPSLEASLIRQVPTGYATQAQLLPSLHGLTIRLADDWTAQLYQHAERVLPSLLCKLKPARYTNTAQHATLGLAKLILQPSWKSAEESLAESLITRDALAHGSLWYGDYGEDYGQHRNETVQLIRCKSDELQSLVRGSRAA